MRQRINYRKQSSTNHNTMYYVMNKQMIKQW